MGRWDTKSQLCPDRRCCPSDYRTEYLEGGPEKNGRQQKECYQQGQTRIFADRFNRVYFMRVTYVGHTSTNQKGYEHSRYVCGNRYRTQTCQSKSINAAEIEEFVIQHLKLYLLESDFTKPAEDIPIR